MKKGYKYSSSRSIHYFKIQDELGIINCIHTIACYEISSEKNEHQVTKLNIIQQLSVAAARIYQSYMLLGSEKMHGSKSLLGGA